MRAIVLVHFIAAYGSVLFVMLFLLDLLKN